MKTNYVIGAGTFLLIAILLVSQRFIAQKTQAQTISDPATLPGIQISNGPWQPETAHLHERLRAIGLPELSTEGSALHIHQHLDIFVHGASLPIPAEIGIHQSVGFLTDIHTHDATGIIHVESPTIQNFTLGQFFDIWGVRFTAMSLGGYVADGTNSLKVFVNGKEMVGDPRAIVLAEKQEIAIVYGTPQETPSSIPSSYAFGPGF